MRDLTLATSPELLDELFRRYPEAVFIGMKESPTDDETGQYYSRFQGHSVFVQGMCARMIRRVQDAESYPEESEEDL